MCTVALCTKILQSQTNLIEIDLLRGGEPNHTNPITQLMFDFRRLFRLALQW